jgi:DNA polymerase-3 subunit gamma/tau
LQKIALYRKYRPENFDQLVGQEHISRVLKNAIAEAKISHAYLFSGPRGTGKTSVARILAKAINCTNRKDYNPCGKCNICVGINEGRIMDLIEIDAASNRGIDEIRDLREKVKFSPTEGAYKVFIIDEVHMLTKEAFNALLKTLEEPPAHAIFILATTEINRVPNTIISRCQRHDFKRIKLAEIVARLIEVKKSEKINITDEALELIAETSEGGLRDALSLIDQLSSVGLDKIEASDVEAILGLAPFNIVNEFISAICDGNQKAALAVIEKASSDGIDLLNLTKAALEFTRKLLAVKIAGTEVIEGTKEQIEKLKELSEKVTGEKLILISDELIWAGSVFKTNVDPKVILTIVAAKEYDDQPRPVSQPPVSTTLAPTAQSAPAPAPAKNQNRANGKWQHFLLEIKAKNNTIHAFLRVANPQFNGTELTLTFPYKFHKERIEEAKVKRMVESILEKVYGEQIVLTCALEGNGTVRNQKTGSVESGASILGGEVVD